MRQSWFAGVLALLGLLLLFASCGPGESPRGSQALSGRILLWHTWADQEGDWLTQVVASFEDLYPGVTVRQQRFASQAELTEQFLAAARSGLGPDLVIMPSAEVQTLARSGSLASLEGLLEEDILTRFMPSTLDMLRVDGALMGMPISLDTQAIYVNRTLVEQPVNSLDGLIAQASQGQTVLLPINFYDAFWGLQAFGGRLFSEDGQVILDQGGFANWVAWLRDARNAPGMIQDTNREVLRQRFVAGDAGYYFGYTTELTGITAALGAENVAVLALPPGPVGSAGPFLSTRAFMLSSASSSNQQRVALELAKFVTNSEQSGRLVRLAGQVPANTRVRINPRLNQIAATFAAQARSAVPVPIRPEYAEVARVGNEAYTRVLEGGEAPVDVAFAVSAAINEANGFAVQATPTLACTGLGTVRLVHTWEDQAEQEALAELVERFRSVCPLIIVQLESMNATQLRARLTGGDGLRPTFALVSQETLRFLAEEPGLLMNMTGIVTAETLQKFHPTALEAMRVNGNLFGIPLNISVDVHYYNTRLVTEPAQLVDDLRAQAAAGVPITLDTRFAHAFWGVGAFGGQLFDGEYRVVLDQGGFADWLTWLRDARDLYGMRLSDDGDELRERFIAGESAYYVGGPQELPELRQAVGAANLGTSVLPAGPAGTASPLAQVRGFVYLDGASEQQINLARTFARYATDPDAQAFLMEAIDKVPANASVVAPSDGAYAVFTDQFLASRIVPNVRTWRFVEELGDRAYQAVLQEGGDPATVAAEITVQINEAAGFLPIPLAPTPDPMEQAPDAETGDATEADSADSDDDGEAVDPVATPAAEGSE